MAFLSFMALTISGAALSGQTTTVNTHKSTLASLRDEGRDMAAWRARPFTVKRTKKEEQVNRVYIILPLSEITARPGTEPLQEVQGLKSYTHGQNQQDWYVLAGFGSKAVTILSGAPTNPDGRHLQKRAKIGTAQLGLARDIGAGRVTLGYLRHNEGRDQLVHYSTNRRSQDLAAMTLTIKR